MVSVDVKHIVYLVYLRHIKIKAPGAVSQCQWSVAGEAVGVGSWEPLDSVHKHQLLKLKVNRRRIEPTGASSRFAGKGGSPVACIGYFTFFP